MCGRYYIDDETAAEIERLVLRADEKLAPECGGRDIYPASLAPVLTAGKDRPDLQWQFWGLPGYRPKQVIFNARRETALEKPAFRDSVRNHRAVVPAAWFYEWNKSKEKITFYRKDRPALYMAGCFRQYEDGGHYVILTAQANDSMRPVHDRMPLVLEEEEIRDWLFDDGKTEYFLKKIPPLLERRAEYEQQQLFE